MILAKLHSLFSHKKLKTVTKKLPSASKIKRAESIILDTLLLPLRNAGLTCVLSIETAVSSSINGDDSWVQHRIYSSAFGHAPYGKSLEEQMEWQLEQWRLKQAEKPVKQRRRRAM